MNRTLHRTLFSLSLLAGVSTSSPLLADSIDYKALYNRAASGVVVVYAADGIRASRGTGSIVSKQGLVLTNTHVLIMGKGPAPTVFVYTKPAKLTGDPRRDLKHRHEAKIVALHHRYDLALIQIVRPPASLTVLPLSDLKNVGVGEPTVAIGHPGGGSLWSLTTGKLSAAFQDFERVQGWHIFQTETAINPGNSGGPLLDGTGAIIGVNTFIRRQGKGGLALVGLGFAVQASTAQAWIRGVLGKLPPASAFSRGRTRAPSPPLVKKAPPPDHGKVKRPKPKKEQWTMRAPKKGQRRDRLARPRPRPRKGFTTRLRPGRVYGGTAVQRMSSRKKASFDELDRVLDKSKK